MANGQSYTGGARATFAFDAAGRQTAMQDVTGFTTYLWDNAGRQVGVINGQSKALTYTLDPVGNRIGMVDPNGGLTTYTWHAQNRLTGIFNPYNAFTTLQYDALDRECAKVLGAGSGISGCEVQVFVSMDDWLKLS